MEEYYLSVFVLIRPKCKLRVAYNPYFSTEFGVVDAETAERWQLNSVTVKLTLRL